MSNLIIVGAGGHTRPVIDIAVLLGYNIVGIIDTNYSGEPEKIMDIEVIGGLDILKEYHPDQADVFVAIGDNAKRKETTEEVIEQGFAIPNMVHPSAIISNSAQFGGGILINAGAIINAMSEIGNGVILNTGAIIDHECKIGAFVHLAPGTALAGRVQVGEGSFVGIGSSVIDKIKIGSHVMVGAGSVIIRDLADDERVVGASKKL